MYHKCIGEQPFAREAQQLSSILIQNAQIVSIIFVQLVTKPNLLAHQMKGNINPNGEKQYYKPGDPNYNQVNPEQLFMSEEEAKVAGFIRIFRP